MIQILPASVFESFTDLLQWVAWGVGSSKEEALAQFSCKGPVDRVEVECLRCTISVTEYRGVIRLVFLYAAVVPSFKFIRNLLPSLCIDV